MYEIGYDVLNLIRREFCSGTAETGGRAFFDRVCIYLISESARVVARKILLLPQAGEG